MDTHQKESLEEIFSLLQSILMQIEAKSLEIIAGEADHDVAASEINTLAESGKIIADLVGGLGYNIRQDHCLSHWQSRLDKPITTGS